MGKSMMRVLVIDEWLPYPPDSGKKIRTFNLLKPLARRHEIDYLCYGDPTREHSKIERLEEAGFRVTTVRPVRKYRTKLSLAAGVIGNLPCRTPLVVRKHYSRRFQQALRQVLNSQPFDVIHCEWTHFASFLRESVAVPTFLCSHNVECTAWHRFSANQTNPIRRAALYLEWLKMRSFERRFLPRFDHLAAVSENDAHMMKSWFRTPSVDVIPNGVDVDFYDRKCVSREEDLLVYCASMDAWVNQDAAIYFVQNILPRIQRLRPQTQLMIVGRQPSAAIRRLASDHVIVTGTVDDVRPLLERATVNVVPLRIAGGSRLKILESFAARVPVVSTSIGAEGLAVRDGREFLLADGEDAFTTACVRLLENNELRHTLTDAAWTFAKEKHDWKAISPLVESAWERTLENGHREDVPPLDVPDGSGVSTHAADVPAGALASAVVDSYATEFEQATARKS
jgi:glycosyltransferase involved in cell wall biosynthesis